MENKFAEGSLVYARENPKLHLIIRRYLHHIYYCRERDNPEERERVYFERDLFVKDDPKFGH